MSSSASHDDVVRHPRPARDPGRGRRTTSRKLMRRSLHFIWPRAESNLYAEPKRLVEAGLADGGGSWNGDRKRPSTRSRRQGTQGAPGVARGGAGSPAPRVGAAPAHPLRQLGSKDDLLAAIDTRRGRRGGVDHALLRRGRRVRTRRRALPRAHPRQRAPRHAHRSSRPGRRRTGPRGRREEVERVDRRQRRRTSSGRSRTIATRAIERRAVSDAP